MASVLVVEDDRPTRLLLASALRAADFTVAEAGDGAAALKKLRDSPFDLIITDVWMPRMNGLELLARLRSEARRPRVIVMTSDGTTETLLRAIREQAYRYVTKPLEPAALVELAIDALRSVPESPPIEVLSARPEWVELLVPCDVAVAERIHGFLAHLRSDLSNEVRESLGLAFRELLMNAVEWGGKLDRNRKVRISCVRTGRVLLYRISDPGEGFHMDELQHAAIANPVTDPVAHVAVRDEKGLRPGGFGIFMTRQLVDELIYNEAGNEVLLIKYL